MAVIKEEITVYVCERCGHRWIKRKERYPRLCPKCKSVNWDVPKKKKNGNLNKSQAK